MEKLVRNRDGTYGVLPVKADPGFWDGFWDAIAFHFRLGLVLGFMGFIALASFNLTWAALCLVAGPIVMIGMWGVGCMLMLLIFWVIG